MHVCTLGRSLSYMRISNDPCLSPVPRVASSDKRIPTAVPYFTLERTWSVAVIPYTYLRSAYATTVLYLLTTYHEM